MVIKRLSCVFRLSDAGSGRLLTRSEVSFREGRFPPPLLSVCAIASFRVVNVRLLVRK